MNPAEAQLSLSLAAWCCKNNYDAIFTKCNRAHFRWVESMAEQIVLADQGCKRLRAIHPTPKYDHRQFVGKNVICLQKTVILGAEFSPINIDMGVFQMSNDIRKR